MINDRYIYRGKTTSTGDWLEGNLSYNYGDYFIFPIEDAYDSADCYRIDLATAGQCTGLRDKRGKLVFEGDIVKTDMPERIGEVKYLVDAARYLAVPSRSISDVLIFEHLSKTEIIGNRWENPELLEAVK